MTASLAIKNEKYYAIVTYKDDGKVKQKWVALGIPAKNNKRKAEAMLEKIRQEYEGIYSTPTGDTPFVVYLKKWLQEKKEFIQESTWEGYKICTESHIIPYFEELDLSVREIQPLHIKKYYDDKYKSGRKDGREGGLSIKTIKRHSVIFKEALGDAAVKGMISRNPAIGVKMPAKEEKFTDIVFLDAEQVNEMLKCFDGHPLRALVYTTIYYGLRRSEVLGLKWSAVDFENNTLSINHTVVQNLTIIEKDTTKTETSKHTYRLIEDVKAVLLELKKQQEQNQKELGSAYVDSGYIFTWKNGERFNPEYVTRGFQRALASGGFQKMRFHDLRHSTASILYDKGWGMKDIQLWLRHSNISVTADIYTHVTKNRKAKMADLLNSTFVLTNHD